MSRVGVTESRLASEIAQQQAELTRRERRYRGERPFPDLAGKTLLVIDDGLATGSTMEACPACALGRVMAVMVRGMSPESCGRLQRSLCCNDSSAPEPGQS